MDMKKIGNLLKELRKEKQITQEDLAEMLGVSNRTVSRWETGTNMPDFDILIELADFYEVDVREILEGEKKGNSFTNEKDNLLLIADYNNQAKKKVSTIMRWLFLSGLLAMVLCLLLENFDGTEVICHFLLGAVFGILLLGLLYTTKYITKIREYKLKFLNRKRSKGND